MKKLLIGLLTLGSLSSFAGEIINRESNEKIIFEHIENDIQVYLVARNGEMEGFIIKPEELNANFIKASKDLKEERITYKGTKLFLQDAKNKTGDSLDQVMTYVGLPFVTSMETAIAPIAFSYDNFVKAAFKRDMSVISKAIYGSKSIKVSGMRFARLIETYLNVD